MVSLKMLKLYKSKFNFLNSESFSERIYGIYRKVTPEVKKQRLALLRKAYDEGPHPNAFNFLRRIITLTSLRSLGPSLALCVCAGVLRLPAAGSSQGVPAHDQPSSTA